MTENETPPAADPEATKPEEAGDAAAAAPADAESPAPPSSSATAGPPDEAVPPAEAAPPDEEPPAEEEAEIPYTVKETEEQPGSVRRYVVEVERGAYDSKMEKTFKELKKTVIIDGFRRGKAPIGLLKRRFGKDAQEDVINELSANVSDQIVKGGELDVVGQPQLHESKAEEGQPVTLQIDIEFRPKLDVAGYTGNTLEVEVEPVTDELVEKQLAAVREANATYEPAKSKRKTYQPGDGVTAKIEAVDANGKRLESLCQESVFLRDPREALAPEVARAMVGLKAGETCTQTAERTTRSRKGKEVTHEDAFTVTVQEIKPRVLPDLDDEFAKDLGEFETLEDLRKDIREDLVRQAEERKRQRFMEKILDHLVEGNPFDAPKSIVAAQEYQTIMRDSRRLQTLGLNLESMGLTPESYLQGARANSDRLVKTNLLLDAIAKKENLEVADADVDKEIERMATAEGRKPLAIRARLEAERQLDALRRSLLSAKIEEFLLANNSLKEVAASPTPPANPPTKEEKDRKESEAEAD
ncbi:MAG TPA: trigger factor [Sumerlaeia bacterium]|nr:trigger factor [Sumerlaeia bacterium]